MCDLNAVQDPALHGGGNPGNAGVRKKGNLPRMHAAEPVHDLWLLVNKFHLLG